MTAPQGAPTLPPPSANGATAPGSATRVSAPLPQAASRRHLHTRISGIRTGLITGIVALIVVVVFVIQNLDAVNISFLGAHLRVSLGVALLLCVMAGALLMAAAGTARITQLRRVLRRDRSKTPAA